MGSRILAIFLLVIAANAQTPPTEAGERMQQGVLAFQGADYELAATLFDEAYEMDSSLLDARVYYGYAEMMQYVPGSADPEHVAHAERAREAFEEALERQPDHQLAAATLASLYFNMKDFDNAAIAHKRTIELDPSRTESHYTLGVIAWTRSYQPRQALRAELGMRPEDPGPIRDPFRRRELAEELRPILEEGLDHLRQAIGIDPGYGDAMAYANLIERELADLSETQAEYEEHIARADEWVQKALDAKRAKQQ